MNSNFNALSGFTVFPNRLMNGQYYPLPPISAAIVVMGGLLPLMGAG